MNIIEYALFKKMLGSGGGNNPTAYHLTNANELPTDAVDGSLAIVGNDDILGIWKLNEVINIETDIDLYFTFTACQYVNQRFSFNNIYSDGGELSYYNTDTEDEFATLYDANYEGGRWYRDLARTITITEIDDAEAEVWIRANARKIFTLYSRENGEWVSKGEI